MAATTSPSLLARVRNPSDRDAWSEFDARYGELIVRYCRSRGMQHCDAEDIRQVVLLRLARALPGFDYEPSRGRFRAYLGRIVGNEVARHFSSPRGAPGRVDTGVSAAEPACEDREAEAAWDREWLHHHLRLAMRTLRATHDARSLAVFERLADGEPVHAVAAAFGMSTQAVHKVKQRIRDRLRDLVAAQVQQEDDTHGPDPGVQRPPGGRGQQARD
jgi:RNA polymerase sigma-70 factor (ECF subfamily)